MSAPVASADRAEPALLEVAGISRTFAMRRERLFGPRSTVAAVRDVSFRLDEQTTLGIVGESGSGKSTLARCVLNLIPPDEGRVTLRGRDITALDGRELRTVRTDMAMIFQNPYSSLDPTWTVEKIVGEALAVQHLADGIARRAKVEAVLDRVGLPASSLKQRPSEFSGGQRQRIAIARALVTDPALVVCDEAVSSLDVSTRSQVLQLLHDLQERLGLAYLFISHDLSVVRSVSDRVAVMYLGEIVEIGKADDVLYEPLHPYTKALQAAVPTIDRAALGRRRRAAQPLRGEPPSPVSLPSGCSFHERCPIAMPMCTTTSPVLLTLDDGRSVACHAVSDPRTAPVSVRSTHPDEETTT